MMWAEWSPDRRSPGALAKLCPEKAPPVAAMLVLGDVSVTGNIKGLRSLVEPLQIAMDNGAKKALIPIENKRAFLEVTGDVVEHVDPIFFSDPKTAAFKALGLN
jgi:ATP-dependent Lon protease